MGSHAAPFEAKRVVALLQAEGDPRSQRMAALAIGELGVAGLAHASVLAGKPLEERGDPQLRAAACHALGALGEARTKQAQKWAQRLSLGGGPLVSQSVDHWGRLRTAAEELQRLPQLPNASCVARLLQDRDPGVRREAAMALGRLGNEGGARRHAGRMLGLLADPDQQVRAAAAEALGRMLEGADEGAGCFGTGVAGGPFGIENVVDRLGALLEDEASEVRAAAARALGGLGEQGGARALEVARLLQEENRQVRQAAQLAVGTWAARGSKETRPRSCPKAPEFARLWWPPNLPQPSKTSPLPGEAGRLAGPWVP